MPIATPNLTLTITPPGGGATDYTSYFAYSGSYDQAVITQNFGRQGDTATFALVDEYVTTPHITIIPVMSQIKLRDNNLGVVLFAGVVNDPQLQVTSPNRNEWTLNCTDYAYYADNSTPVFGTFNGFTSDVIVASMTAQANCGITAATIAAGGFVAPGPLLPAVHFQYQSLSAAWKFVAKLASQVTPYGWYVDENRALHFYDATSALNSGVTFTTHPTVGGSSSEGHMLVDNTNSYEWDGTSVHNRILVRGASQLIYTSIRNTAPTDHWRGDGTDSAWPLRYAFGSPGLLLINNVNTPVNTVPAGGPNSSGSQPSASWNVIQNNTGQYFLTANSAPGAGTSIQFWYSYNIPIVAQVNDLGSQATYTGPNGGVFGEYIADMSLVTTTMALARATRERQEYSFAVERVVFTTSPDFLGWVRAGYTFQYINQFVPDVQNGNTLGVNDTFLCTQNRITFGDGGYRTMQVTGVRI